MKEKLIDEAIRVRKNAYTPYSRFKVGAALLTTSGEIYTGCNIENAAYPTTCCAERVAIFQAISKGIRTFEQLAVVADTNRPVPPCGSCLQVMSEFFTQSTKIHLANVKGEVTTVTMKDLLPYAFQKNDLENV